MRRRGFLGLLGVAALSPSLPKVPAADVGPVHFDSIQTTGRVVTSESSGILYFMHTDSAGDRSAVLPGDDDPAWAPSGSVG